LCHFNLAKADNKTWTGSTSTDWFNAANWTPAGVPAAGDNVFISSGTVVANAAVSLAGLSLSGGNLTLAGTTSVTNFTWTGGVLQGAGPLSVAAAGTMSIGGSAVKVLRAQSLRSHGTAIWSGTGAVVGDQNGMVVNYGSLEVQGNAGFGRYTAAGTFTFLNNGTLTKTGGTGITGFTNTFNNNGTVRLLTGTLSLAGGGTQAGSMSNAPGTTLIFDGGTHVVEATAELMGGGTVKVDGATADFQTTNLLTGSFAVVSGTATVASGPALGPLSLSGGSLRLGKAAVSEFAMSGGTLVVNPNAGVLNLTVTNLNWTAGIVQANGTITIPEGGTLGLSGNSLKFLRLATLENKGTTTWAGTGSVLGDMDGAFVNSGRFEALNNAGFGRYTASGTFTFDNRGLLLKSGGVAVTGFTNTFLNSGTVLVPSGSLSLVGGGSQTGIISNAPGTTVIFDGGTHLVEAGAQLLGGGAWKVDGATVSFLTQHLPKEGMTIVSGAATFADDPQLGPVTITGGSVKFGTARLGQLTMSGGNLGVALAAGVLDLTVTNLSWAGGTIQANGSLTVPGEGLLSLGGTTIKFLRQAALHNYGRTVWTGTGSVLGDLGGSFVNHGTFEAQNNASFGPYTAAGTFGFYNEGLLVKSPGVGLTGFTNAFYNSGTVLVPSGTLTLAGGGSQTGTISNAPGTVLVFAGGTHGVEAGARLTGGGTVRVDGATVTFESTNLLTGGFSVVSGTAIFADFPVLPPFTLSGGAAKFGAARLGLVTFSGGSLGVAPNAGILALVVTNFTWSAGTLQANGAVTVPAGGFLNLGGNTAKFLRQATLNNYGAATWTGTGAVLGDLGGALVNYGSFEAQNNASFAPYTAAGTFRFYNLGQFVKSVGTGITGFTNAFLNSGSFVVKSGTARFNSSYVQDAGSTELAGGNLSTSTTISIEKGSLSGHGTISGSVANAGDLYPGSTNGVLTITGNYTQTGRLLTRLGGLTPGAQFNQLVVQGTSTLGGNLTVYLADGYLPAAGNVFEVVRAKTRAGTFDATAGLVLGSELELGLSYGTTNVVLTTIQAAAGMPLGMQMIDCGRDGLELRFAGTPGRTNVIQASTDLLDWVPILTVESAPAMIHVLDAEAASHPVRFYRGLVQ
jgi:hypothetical protein